MVHHILNRSELQKVVRCQLGLVPTIDIRFHSGQGNPILEFTPAALRAARILGEAVNQPVVPVSHEDYHWFNIGTNITIFITPCPMRPTWL